MQIYRQLTIIAGIAIMVFLLLLILKIYATWLGVVLIGLVVLMIFINMTSTIFIPKSKFHIKELCALIDFRDDKGKLVHITLDLLTKPFKDIAKEYIDRGLVGSGKINNFESFRFINDKWQKIEPLKRTIEGAETVVTTPFDPPMSAKEWTKRRLEFDCIDCFTEKEESLVYRVDSETDLYSVTFNFHPNRRTEKMTVFEVIGGYKKQLDIIYPYNEKPQVFKWSIKKPHFGSNYLFLWIWL